MTDLPNPGDLMVPFSLALETRSLNLLSAGRALNRSSVPWPATPTTPDTLRNALEQIVHAIEVSSTVRKTYQHVYDIARAALAADTVHVNRNDLAIVERVMSREAFHEDELEALARLRAALENK